MFEKLSNIHKLSYNNKEECKLSNMAACFHCLNKFSAKEIISFKDEKHATCPKCGKNTVIGDKTIKGKFIVPFNLNKKVFLTLNETFDTNSEFES